MRSKFGFTGSCNGLLACAVNPTDSSLNFKKNTPCYFVSITRFTIPLVSPVVSHAGCLCAGLLVRHFRHSRWCWLASWSLRRQTARPSCRSTVRRWWSAPCCWHSWRPLYRTNMLIINVANIIVYDSSLIESYISN